MASMKQNELRELLRGLQRQLADVGERVARLEAAASVRGRRSDLQAPAPTAIGDAPQQPEHDGEIPEEILLAISAAIGAFLGERAHVRQVRLLSSRSWSQQGRVSIQASHRLH